MSVLDDVWGAGEDAYDGFQDWNEEGQDVLDGPANEDPSDVAADVIAEEPGWTEEEAQDAVDASQDLEVAEDALSDYYDSEMERWEETKDDPLGTFVDGLFFGATGPAPSIGPDGSYDYGPGFIGWLNEEAAETVYGEGNAPENPGDGNEQVLPWWAKYAAGGAVLLVLLVVLAPYAELGSEVAG